MSITRLVQTLLPHYASDFVAVYDQNFNQVFPLARPMKLFVREEARVMEHPIENGAIITDHRVILPVEISFSMMLNSIDYPNVYRAIRQFYLDGTLLVVQTKTGVYRNQLIQSIPHEENPDQYNAVPLALRFKQALFVSESQTKTPKNPTNTSTVDRGIQNTSPATPQQTTGASNSINSLNMDRTVPEGTPIS